MVVEPDIYAAADRGENTSRMELLLISDASRHRPALADLAVERPCKLRACAAASQRVS